MDNHRPQRVQVLDPLCNVLGEFQRLFELELGVVFVEQIREGVEGELRKDTQVGRLPRDSIRLDQLVHLD